MRLEFPRMQFKKSPINAYYSSLIKKNILCFIGIISLSGCSTVGGVVAIPMYVVDVATIAITGGLVDPGLGGSTQQLIDHGKFTNNGSARLPTAEEMLAISQVAGEINNSRNATTSGSNKSQVSATGAAIKTSQNNSSNQSGQYSKPSSQCIRSEEDLSKSNDSYVYYRITNTCNFKITVTHCYETSQSSARCQSPRSTDGTYGTWWGGHQGNGDLNPGQSTTSVGGYRKKSPRFMSRACEVPIGNSWVHFETTSNGGYMCRILK